MTGTRQWARRALGAALALSTTLGACDSLLEVELPGQITEEALYDPSQAATLVNSAIADIECAYSAFIASNASGNEDVFLRTTGWWGSLEYQPQVSLNQCNSGDTAVGWWVPLQAGRFQAETTYAKIGEWGDQVADREQLLAQAALYAGVTYDLMGEYMCEVAVDGGPLMTPDRTLEVAEEWLTTALGHIGGADFALPATVSPSAEQLAYALRARVRWARSDLEGAAADAARIDKGFTAYVTRDAGGQRKRWNRTPEAHNGSGWATVSGPVDWWEGPGDWPAVIPFTGYRELAVLPDGRAVSDSRHPVTLASGAGAVLDPRVPVVDQGRIFNGFPVWHQRKYPDVGADIPLANWEEIWLILAEIEGGQGAIDRVNEIREHHGLPLVTYLSAGDARGIRDLIIEERRRSLFLEGRFWATKIREDLWFPRGAGRTPYPYTYQTAIRMAMSDSEFELNPNFDESARASLCGDERPLL